MGVEQLLPSAHLRGSLRLFDHLVGSEPWPSGVSEVRQLLVDRCSSMASLPADPDGFKVDSYIQATAGQRTWGVTLNDRWERGALWPEALRLAQSWGQDLGAVRSLGEDLEGADSTLTVGFGFADGGVPPRLKLYFQEERWATGVGDLAQLDRLLETLAPGTAIPGTLSRDLRPGVVSIELTDIGCRVRLYLGGPDPDVLLALVGSSDTEVLALADACRQVPGYWYLRLVLGPDGSCGVTLNKVYEVMQLATIAQEGQLSAAWREADTVLSGRPEREWVRALRLAGDLRLVPTALALDPLAPDLYCAAWEIPRSE